MQGTRIVFNTSSDDFGRYRAHNLELDACTDEHGFWLDGGEATRVREVMRDRVAGLNRSVSAQEAWQKAKEGDKGGLMGKFRNMLGGGKK